MKHCVIDLLTLVDGCSEPEVMTIPSGETIKAAVAPTVTVDGRYQDYLCQQWILRADKETETEFDWTVCSKCIISIGFITIRKSVRPVR